MAGAAPFDDGDDALAVAERWMEEGRELAVATIVAGEGTAAPLVGRRLIVDAGGAVCGALGHGPVEEAAREAAAAVIASGGPRLLDFGLLGGHACLYVERLG